MAEGDGFEPGTPSWVDLGSIDPPTSRAFYTDLFGWEVRDLGADFGGYGFFTLRDKMVAGVGPTQDERTSWMTCFAVADADDVAERTERAGGTVMQPPFDVEDFGRMAVLADPAGAVFAIWRYGSGQGAQVVDEPGSLTWNELVTRDLPGAKRFYQALFGWTVEDVPMGEGEYTLARVGERSVVGMIAMAERSPPEVLPHWLVYFAVDDADATVAQAEELGGRVSTAPRTIPTVGRFAELSGPHGEAFAVLRNE